MVKFGIIGAGAIAQTGYLPAIGGVPGASLARVVDVDEERARRVADEFDAEGYATDHADVLDAVDAVVVATPPSYHREVARDCMEAGVHVMTEKPAALTSEAAADLVDHSEKQGVHYAISRQLREAPAARLLRTFATNGSLGPIRAFEVTYGDETEWAFASDYRLDECESGGGVLIDKGSHVLDLLLWIFDCPFDLHSYRDDSYGGLEANAELELSFEGSDVDGTVEVTGSRDVDNEIRLVGERATIAAAPCGTTATLHDRESGERTRLTAAEANPPTRSVSRLGRQLRRFADAVRTGEETYVPASTDVEILRLFEACYGSREPMDRPWEDQHVSAPEEVI